MWVYDLPPTCINEIALPEPLRKLLSFYERTGKFSHLLFVGDTGVGKTTTARILGHLPDVELIEIDCPHFNSSEEIKKIIRGAHSVSFMKKRKVVILDEFHVVRDDLQILLNKTLENPSSRTTYIICVNDANNVINPIRSRCKELHFDVAVLDRHNKLQMNAVWNLTKQEWTDELKRVGRLVASRAGASITEEQLSRIASEDLYLLDARRFIRNLEELYWMESE